MKKMFNKLDEECLSRIIKESVNKVLNESSKMGNGEYYFAKEVVFPTGEVLKDSDLNIVENNPMKVIEELVDEYDINSLYSANGVIYFRRNRDRGTKEGRIIIAKTERSFYEDSDFDWILSEHAKKHA